MPKLFAVQNPVSGTQSAEQVTQKIEQLAQRAGWEAHIHLTEKGEDVPHVARSAAQSGYELLIAAGGDGTLSAVATGLHQTDIPMGILPVGTGNGLARDLGIPLNIEKALQVIFSRSAVKILDAIQVQDRFYLLNLSAGLTPRAMEETPREQKRQIGRMAYILAGLRVLGGVQPSTYYLTIDGRDIKVRASEVLLLNSMNLGDTGRLLQLDIHNDCLLYTSDAADE